MVSVIVYALLSLLLAMSYGISLEEVIGVRFGSNALAGNGHRSIETHCHINCGGWTHHDNLPGSFS